MISTPCSSGRFSDLRDRLSRIRSAGDRAADDEDRGAVRECLSRCNDALLIGDVRAGGPYARNDEEAGRPGRSGGGDFRA
jgi:hypothetical protein